VPSGASISLDRSFRHNQYSTAPPSPKGYGHRYEDRFLSQRGPNSPRFAYHGDKRCMLVSVILGADFSKGCARSVLVHTFLLTHPTASPSANRPVHASCSNIERVSEYVLCPASSIEYASDALLTAHAPPKKPSASRPKRAAREDGGPYCRTHWLRREELQKTIIRKPERLRMNILSILSILVPTSSLWKVKMLKVFKTLKETTR
jgi:hypothetical protein